MEKNDGFGKKAARKIVAWAAAVSLAAGGLAAPPAELPEQDDRLFDPPAIVDTLLPDPEPEQLPEPEPVDDPEEKKRRQKLPLFARLGIIAGVLAAAALIASLTAAAFAALPAFASALLEGLVGIVLAAAVCWTVLRLEFPDIGPKALLKKKVLIPGVTACVAAGAALSMLVKLAGEHRGAAFLIAAAVAGAAAASVYFRLRKKEK